MVTHCCSAVLNHLPRRSPSNLTWLRSNNAPIRRFRSELVSRPCRAWFVTLMMKPLVVLIAARELKDTFDMNLLLRPISVTDSDLIAVDTQD